jgi:hypothetical protein
MGRTLYTNWIGFLYADQAIHKQKPDPLADKRPKTAKAKTFKPCDFQLADDLSHCLCPAGKRLYRTGKNCTLNGYASVRFQGALRGCEPCTRRHECLRTPDFRALRESRSLAMMKMPANRSGRSKE